MRRSEENLVEIAQMLKNDLYDSVVNGEALDPEFRKVVDLIVQDSDRILDELKISRVKCRVLLKEPEEGLSEFQRGVTIFITSLNLIFKTHIPNLSQYTIDNMKTGAIDCELRVNHSWRQIYLCFGYSCFCANILSEKEVVEIEERLSEVYGSDKGESENG